MFIRERLLERASSGQRESRTLDFKSTFDPQSNGDWCEIIKDMVAFANSGGGIIVFGVNDNGTLVEFDKDIVLSIDGADIINKIERYTGYHFSGFELLELERNGITVAGMLISDVNTLMVFQKPGTYAIADNKQKTAFSKGTVYFRHGSKSEPATMDDLRSWMDKEIEKVRTSWLGGIRRVVEAPAGHEIQVVNPADARAGAIQAVITNDAAAMAVRPQNANEIWPYRQRELLQEVNGRLPDNVHINSHDILSIKMQHDLNPTTRPDFVFKSHDHASPQYSRSFAEWILERYQGNANFFQDAREFFRENH